MKTWPLRLLPGRFLALTLTLALSTRAAAPDYLSPAALVAAPDETTLYIACATAGRVMIFDTAVRRVVGAFVVPDSPQGLALARDARRLYVTCAAPESTVCVIDLNHGDITAKIPTGHTALSPVLSPDGRTLFVCDRFNHEVAFIDLQTQRVTQRVRVQREPVAADLTPDGRLLFVANHLHAGRADVDVVAAAVSVIDVAAARVCREIALPNGSSLIREIRVSPDGRHAAVAHQLSRFHLPTTQLERGWVNTSAASIIDVASLLRINTVLLDNIDAGAANPWAVAWSADGQKLCLTHAGTHELSVIDFPALLVKLAGLANPAAGTKADPTAASRTASDVPNDLSFLVGLRQRIRLPENARGPRSLALRGTQAWIANYFSDSLAVVDLAAARPSAEIRPLAPRVDLSKARRGELLFNDASICFQGWQSCASCHSHDARVDGLNWDNLNDGIGNPKNAKSLLDAHATPPSMWLGVRSNAQVAVRAGIRNSLFTVQPPEVAEAMDEYLRSLRPIPSPHLVRGQLSAAAQRGRALFDSDAVGCAGCHSGRQYTDLKFHDVGTSGKFDQGANRFDTPTLVELWRTGPYLHDGRAANLLEVFTAFNRDDRHGNTSQLKPGELADLVEFILSL